MTGQARSPKAAVECFFYREGGSAQDELWCTERQNDENYAALPAERRPYEIHDGELSVYSDAEPAAPGGHRGPRRT